MIDMEAMFESLREVSTIVSADEGICIANQVVEAEKTRTAHLIVCQVMALSRAFYWFPNHDTGEVWGTIPYGDELVGSAYEKKFKEYSTYTIIRPCTPGNARHTMYTYYCYVINSLYSIAVCVLLFCHSRPVL